MDYLPNEIVLKIIKKCDPSVRYEMKYLNRRMSTFVLIYFKEKENDIGEIRFDSKSATLLLPGDERVSLPTNLSNLGKPTFSNGLNTQIEVCYRMRFMDRFMDRFNIISAYIKCTFTKLRIIEHLEFSNVELRGATLCAMLKNYNVRKCTFANTKLTGSTGDMWKMIVELDIEVTSMDIWSKLCPEQKSTTIVLDNNFLRTQKMAHVKIRGVYSFYVGKFLALISTAIEEKWPINWSIDCAEQWLNYKLINDFIIKKSTTIVVIEINELKPSGNEVIIKSSRGKVTFTSNVPFSLWKKKAV